MRQRYKVKVPPALCLTWNSFFPLTWVSLIAYVLFPVMLWFLKVHSHHIFKLLSLLNYKLSLKVTQHFLETFCFIKGLFVLSWRQRSLPALALNDFQNSLPVWKKWNFVSIEKVDMKKNSIKASKMFWKTDHWNKKIAFAKMTLMVVRSYGISFENIWPYYFVITASRHI